MNRNQIFALFILLFALACTKPPDYPDEPVIEFISLSRSEMVQSSLLSDSITVTISFTDGDGDIGEETNTAQIFITDPRYNTPAVLTKSIPYVPEQGAGNGISGTMAFSVYPACCFYDTPAGIQITCEPLEGYPTDILQYEIYIKDRAGNESNTVVTDPITLLCQ